MTKETLMLSCVENPDNVPRILSDPGSRDQILNAVCKYLIERDPKSKKIIFAERYSKDSVTDSGLLNLITILYSLNPTGTLKLLSQIDNFTSSLTPQELQQVFTATAIICSDPRNQENTVTLMQNKTLRDGFIAYWQKEDKTLTVNEIMGLFFPKQSEPICCK